GSGNELDMQKSQPTKIDSTPVLIPLLLAAKSCVKEIAAAGERHEFSVDEWLILDALSSSDGLTMSQLQQRCVGAASSITRAVDCMFVLALVLRGVGQSYSRLVFVHISTLCDSLYTTISRELGRVEVQLNHDLQDADIDPATLTAVLEK